MSADKDEFLFLISTPLSQASKEQHEQQHLQARAHAARKSHAKRRSDGLTHKWVRWEAKAASQQPVSPDLGVALASSTVAAVVEPSSPPIPVSQPWSQSSLDNGNDEPFSTLAVHPLPPYVFSLLYAASSQKWSRVKPSPNDGSVNPVARAWMGAAMECPVALHALVYAMLRTVLLVRNIPGREGTLVLQHYAQCLSHLQCEMKAIEDGTRAVSDNLIIGIAALSAHGEPQSKKTQTGGSRLNISPLAETQNLDVYGVGRMEHEHMQAVYLLVREKGGLQNIALDGLPDVLEVVDICYATRAHTKPQFGWRHTMSLSDLAVSYSPDAQARRLLRQLGKGFDEIPELSGLGDTVYLIRDVVVALDQYERRSRERAGLPVLLRARNAVQHHLLCLPQAEMNPNTGGIDCSLQEICRLGFLIFSNLALFPLPAASGVAARLVGMLRGCLLDSTISLSHVNVWSQYSTLVTWAAVLGGIASSSLSEHLWYVNYLADITALTPAPEWHSVEEDILSRYIWWRHTCSQLGERVWMEAYTIAQRRAITEAPPTAQAL